MHFILFSSLTKIRQIFDSLQFDISLIIILIIDDARYLYRISKVYVIKCKFYAKLNGYNYTLYWKCYIIWNKFSKIKINIAKIVVIIIIIFLLIFILPFSLKIENKIIQEIQEENERRHVTESKILLGANRVIEQNNGVAIGKLVYIRNKYFSGLCSLTF